jgi:hypothetical protein
MSVAGYKLRIDGVTVIDVGNVLTHDVTGLAAGSSHGFEVLAYDQAGNESEYCDSVVGSTLSPPSTSIYIDYDPAGLALANNDPISTLVDSVAARNATQSGSNRPTYVTNAINTSLPAIDFLKSSAE